MTGGHREKAGKNRRFVVIRFRPGALLPATLKFAQSSWATPQYARKLTVCRRIEGRNVHETTHRALQNCGRVFRYARYLKRPTLP
ncbi:MAG: phage integrase central domain-containing protein [Steroidobacteraceae bacterium]